MSAQKSGQPKTIAYRLFRLAEKAIWAFKDDKELVLEAANALKSSEYNAIIRENGVVWAECKNCGRTWPFPQAPSENRIWFCTICSSALWAKAVRNHAEKPEFIRDEELQEIALSQMKWIAEKFAISPKTGALALLSILISVRDRAFGIEEP